MQFFPGTMTAALGGKIAAKGQQAGKSAGAAKAAQQLFGSVLGQANRVQANGASQLATMVQQASQMPQARASFSRPVAQAAQQVTQHVAATPVTSQVAAKVVASNQTMAQTVAKAVAAESGFANLGNMASRVMESLNNRQIAAPSSVQSMLAQAVAVAAPEHRMATAQHAAQLSAREIASRNAQIPAASNSGTTTANAEKPVSRVAGKNIAPQNDETPQFVSRATTSTKAAENLVERVAGKTATPVATADASAQNIRDAQETMLEAETGQEAPRVKVANPYTRHTTDGVTYTLQEVSFTRKDLQELRATLVQEGVAPAKIAELDKLIEMPDGATLGQVMLKLKGERTPVELEDKEVNDIDAQCNSVDPSGVLASSFIQAIAADNPRGALNQLDAALGALDSTETIEVTKSGMLAMAKALGMDENALQDLANTFGEAEHATVTVGQFGALLAPATEKIVAEKANQDKLDAALAKTIKPIIAKARERMEKENQAHSLQDRKVAQSKAQIERTVQEKSREILDATLDASGENEVRENVQRQSAVFAQSETVVGKPGQHGNEKVRDERTNTQPQATQTPAAAQSADNRAAVAQADNNQPVAGENQTNTANAFTQQAGHNGDNHSEMQQDSRNNGQRENGNEAPREEQSAGWQELLNKVNVQPATATPEQPVFGMNQPAAFMEKATLANAQPEPLAAHLVSQVESGMLRTLRNGATSLELQLHPQELGTLNVVLTSLNGEVSAKIVANKGETVEMLNHHTDAIRSALEEQGVKVEKIEVELRQNEQENSDFAGWQDTESHNSWQEQETRRQTLSRIRNLANVRNNNTNSESSTLERSVHIIGRTAENAATALDMVA